MLSYPFTFPKINGRLIRRVNRFVIEAEVDGQNVEAYLPNPGRLWELLLPGTELMLGPASANAKLPYTVLACRKEGQLVLLHTHLTNRIICRLIEEGKLKLFKDYRVAREEPAYGRNRFDLLLKHQATGGTYYLEVKTCTLFAGSVAMFPDAVTKRGTDHLLKLKEISGRGIKTGCLFVVMDPKAKYFLPAYHIDPGFARAFIAVKGAVELQAIGLGFDSSLSTIDVIKEVSIPFELLNAEHQDRGAYLLLIKLESDKKVMVGSLGQVLFKQGYYIYVGSAMRFLSKRLARHSRRKKKVRWHIDYLVKEATTVTAVPIISGDNLECGLAKSLQEMADSPVKGFGSSDCSCPAHLFYLAQNPLHNPRFIDLIQYYRILRLERKLNLHR